MLNQKERDAKKVKREPDSLGLQKEPLRFYSPEDRAIIKIEKKKKKNSSV